MGGTLKDWQSLIPKLNNLIKFDVNGKLKNYITKVTVILEQFVETFEGKPNVTFWNKVVHEEGNVGSGIVYMYSGWITHFFGYEGETDEVEIDSI